MSIGPLDFLFFIPRPDNYAQPRASVWAFGFEVSPGFERLAGRWKGLELAGERVSAQAAVEGLSLPRYRAILRHRCGEIIKTLGEQPSQEISKESKPWVKISKLSD